MNDIELLRNPLFIIYGILLFIIPILIFHGKMLSTKAHGLKKNIVAVVFFNIVFLGDSTMF